MNMKNVDPKNLDALLKTVSSKLNMPPDQLKSELEAGKFDNALNNMKPNEAEQFNKILNNPKLLETFMNAPQAQALYKKLTS